MRNAQFAIKVSLCDGFRMGLKPQAPVENCEFAKNYERFGVWAKPIINPSAQADTTIAHCELRIANSDKL